MHRRRHGHRHHHRTRLTGVSTKSNTIQYNVDQDGIALLTFNLPGKSMNVLTPELMHELDELVKKAAADDTVKGLVLTSGKAAFIAGADIKDMVTAYDRGITSREGYELSLIHI